MSADNHTPYPCQQKKDILDGPQIEPLALDGNESVADLIDNVYAKSGFNARRLAAAAQLYVRMLDSGATVCMTVAGAMTPIGMSGIFKTLIERGFVDFFVCTGANIYHDLHRPYEFPMVQGSPDIDDNELAHKSIARIYDVFIHDDDTLEATDKVILDAAKALDPSKPFSTATLHHHLGKNVQSSAPHPEKSFVAVAAAFDVPLYTSSPGDSSIGMNLIMPHMFESPLQLSPMLDVIETAAIVREAERNGVVVVGGGSPKNFYLQTQPTLHQILYDDSKGGHDYFLQLTTDSPHWGGLSGATPSEARSWGKLKDAYENNVVVYSCASLTLPLIAQYALCRAKPRPQKRLFAKIDEMTEQLRQSAANNERLRACHPEYFKSST